MTYKEKEKVRIIKVFYDDGEDPKKISWDGIVATIKDIKAKAGIPADKMVIQKSNKGVKILKDSDVINVPDQGASLSVQPNVIHGDLAAIDYKRNRKARYLISQLMEYAEERYRNDKVTTLVAHDLSYVYIPDFPLPSRWKQRQIPLLVHIPESYPDSPPLGFYVPHGTCLKNGSNHPHQFCRAFYSQPDLHDKGWDWFCLYLQNSTDWKPKDDPLKPHKFWTYIDIIKTGLDNLDIRM